MAWSCHEEKGDEKAKATGSRKTRRHACHFLKTFTEPQGSPKWEVGLFLDTGGKGFEGMRET